MIFPANYGVCPICNKRKGGANHKKCSRILQQRRNKEEWDTTLNSQRIYEIKRAARKASTQLIRRKNHIEGYQGEE